MANLQFKIYFFPQSLALIQIIGKTDRTIRKRSPYIPLRLSDKETVRKNIQIEYQVKTKSCLWLKNIPVKILFYFVLIRYIYNYFILEILIAKTAKFIWVTFWV